MPIAVAAELLDLTPAYVLHQVRRGGPGERRDGVWLANAEAVRERRAEREEWVSFGAAARLIGCSTSAISYHARTGHLEQRPVTSTGSPSLRRGAVLAFGEERARVLAMRAERSARSRASEPPEDGFVWLDTATVALLLGLSDSRVRQLARRGSLPYTQRAKRRWFRRDHIEVIAAARAARQSHGATTTGLPPQDTRPLTGDRASSAGEVRA